MVSYSDLLGIFWNAHSPTSYPFSQQYASIIFYYNDEQKALAETSRDRIETDAGRQVLTDILPANFYPAEDYHQKYYLRGEKALADEYLAIYPDESDFVLSTATARVNGYLAGYGSEADLQRELGNLGLSPAGQELLLKLTGSGLESVCPVPD